MFSFCWLVHSFFSRSSGHNDFLPAFRETHRHGLQLRFGPLAALPNAGTNEVLAGMFGFFLVVERFVLIALDGSKCWQTHPGSLITYFQPSFKSSDSAGYLAVTLQHAFLEKGNSASCCCAPIRFRFSIWEKHIWCKLLLIIIIQCRKLWAIHLRFMCGGWGSFSVDWDWWRKIDIVRHSWKRGKRYKRKV